MDIVITSAWRATLPARLGRVMRVAILPVPPFKKMWVMVFVRGEINSAPENVQHAPVNVFADAMAKLLIEFFRDFAF